MEQADLITTSVNCEVDKSDVLANTTPSQANDKRDWDDYCQNAGPSSPQDAEVAGNHAPEHGNTNYDPHNPQPTTQTSALVMTNQL